MSILKDIYKYGERDPKAKEHRSVIEKVYVCYTIQTLEMYNWFADEWQYYFFLYELINSIDGSMIELVKEDLEFLNSF